MNEIINNELNIENMIYEIRGKQVMLDRDLAKLYNVETRLLNQKVKRNKERFPDNFCFQMSQIEFNNWKSQFVISKNDIIGLRRPPYVFTEQGVAMLSAIINSDVAITVSVNIMNAFVNMRKYISNSLFKNKILIDHENRLSILEESFNKLNYKEKNNHLFFEGQIYDAYSLLLDILFKSNEEIIIIDNYAGKELLDLLKNIDKKIIVVSKNIDDNLKKKYKSQYNNVDFIENNTIHDRFIIIDKKELYISGSSFKDLGKKCFYIGKVEDIEILNNLLSKI